MSTGTARSTGWSELDAANSQPPGPDWRVAKSFVTVAGADVLLADDPLGLRHVLVPFPENKAEVLDVRSSGVHILTRILEDEAGRHRYLDVACQKRHLTPIFEHLADDILARLSAGEKNVAAVCIAVLGRWRELLNPEAGHLLSQQALAGLFGELEQLRELCAVDPRLVRSWTGPRGARHDFTAPGKAIEVKSTMARDGWRVRIHGLTQLDAQPGEALFIRVYRLELNGMSGQTVPQLVRGLVDAGVNRAELFELLSASGYAGPDEDYYGRYRFAVLEQRTERVSERTPRLVPSSFTARQTPVGVEDVEYTVDLAASSAVNMDQQEIIETLNAFAGSALHAPGP
jgi:hypothetical protein